MTGPRLELRIPSGAAPSWDDIMEGRPASLHQERRADERHWLLGAQDEATVARLLAHASAVGVRLTMNDPRS